MKRIVCIAAVLVGCERRSTPPTLTEVPATQAAATAPTTRELLEGPRIAIPLRAIPFNISVPRGWDFKSEAGITVLQGPSPDGIVQIAIGKHASPIPDHAKRLIEGAKKESADHPGPYTLATVHQDNGVQILETRVVAATRQTPTIDADGVVLAPTSTPMRWKISAFVTNGTESDICEINFVDLTREQYDHDKDFLQQIIASLQYDPKALTH